MKRVSLGVSAPVPNYGNVYYEEQDSLPTMYNNWIPEGHNYTTDSEGCYVVDRGSSFEMSSGYYSSYSQWFYSPTDKVWVEQPFKADRRYRGGRVIKITPKIEKANLDAWMASHPNDTAVIFLTLSRTYDANNHAGPSFMYAIKWYFPHEMPTVTTSVTETNPVLGGTNNLVLPVSKKNVQVSSSYSMSNITGVTVSVSTVRSTVSQAASSNLARTLLLDTTKINQSSLNGISDPKINVDIHDSRGRTSRFELSFPYYRYIPPEVLSFEASRDKDVATEIYAKSVVDLVSIPGYTTALEYSINDSPYSMANFVNTDRGFLTSLPLGEAFAIKLRLTDNYGFSKIYTDLAVSHSDIMEIYHDRIVFKVPVYDKEGNRIF